MLILLQTVKFQNGNLAVVSKENLKFCLMKDRRSNSKKALVVASGQAYCGDLKDDPLTDTYICVRNKSTNKVTENFRNLHKIFIEISLNLLAFRCESYPSK